MEPGPCRGEPGEGENERKKAFETLRAQPETVPDFFYLDSPQPLEKPRFGRIKPSKSKDFCLDLLGFAWLILVVLVAPRARLAGGRLTRRPIHFG
jgi:hypothetical protein